MGWVKTNFLSENEFSNESSNILEWQEIWPLLILPLTIIGVCDVLHTKLDRLKSDHQFSQKDHCAIIPIRNRDHKNNKKQVKHSWKYIGIHFIWQISHDEWHLVFLYSHTGYKIHHFGNSLCKAHRCALPLFLWKCFLRKTKGKSSKHNQKPISSSIFMIIRFVNWSMQYYSWQTNTHPQFHPRWQHTSAPTHTQRDAQFKTDIFWMLIICLQLHPTWKRDRRRKGGECQGPKWQASTFHNIPFVSLYLYSSRRLCLCTFPNESPYNSKTLISSPWHTD